MAYPNFRLDKKKGVRFALYSIVAIAIITCMVVFLNLIFLFVAVRQYEKLGLEGVDGEAVMEALTGTKQNFILDEEMRRRLDEENQWAMLLDEGGRVLWSYHKPEELGTSYTQSDIARMAKWYLQGYPVRMRVWDDRIMIVGMQKDTMWKYTIEFSISWVQYVQRVFLGVIMLNFLWIILLAVFFTRRWSRTREQARIEWVGGISHDIRTPLSMVMGYAAALENSENLSEEERQQVAVIKHQSIVMKELVADLNLISGLEYSMQALRKEKVRPAVILREVATDFLNDAADGALEIELEIENNAEAAQIKADRQLFIRMLRNLINNSIQHGGQQETVRIRISLRVEGNKCIILLEDNGVGYSGELLARQGRGNGMRHGRAFAGMEKDGRHEIGRKRETAAALHIRGLEIVQKIVQAHGGKIYFGNRSEGGSFCEMKLKKVAKN